ncbi:hypothetical protein NPIL_613611 [Nephila pilipes]|uniref:Uncharacterized protein n=1 Tax=Nephila pilipes TaxID=299642 RepID=A0A8X6UKT7_NEPPI|nr:hypothetical protein NPIL_613611 [Nephila pilipes]
MAAGRNVFSMFSSENESIDNIVPQRELHQHDLNLKRVPYISVNGREEEKASTRIRPSSVFSPLALCSIPIPAYPLSFPTLN